MITIYSEVWPEKSKSIHPDDWPKVEHYLDTLAVDRKLKDARAERLESKYAQARADKADRLRLVRVDREASKQLTYRLNLDRKNGINTLDENINGQLNPLYKPL